MRAPFPALGLLMAIGLADLVATALLHAQGRIVETNPVMAPLLGQGEGAFVVVKAATLGAAAFLLVREGRRNPVGVGRACLAGSGAYLLLLAGTLCRSWGT